MRHDADDELCLGVKVGQRFHRILVIGVGDRTDRFHVKCKCDCGKVWDVRPAYLLKSRTKSCGCLRGEVSKVSRLKSGEASSKKRTKEYRTWAHIKGRCQNPKDAAYKYYGGRGIKMCDEWADDFEKFLSYVGRAPSPIHTLDRIDSNANYEPGNVRWATMKEQSRNQRRTIRFNGESVADICEKRGLPYKTVYARIRRGMSIEEALVIP